MYKWLWTRIGGRPWTYIIRDSYHNHEMTWILCTFGFGLLVGHLFWRDKS